MVNYHLNMFMFQLQVEQGASGMKIEREKKK